MAKRTDITHVGSSTSRRRGRQVDDSLKRDIRLTVRFNAEEYLAMEANAAAVRLAPSAWCARASSEPGVAARMAVGQDERAALLMELMGAHRQLRGASRNLNQVTAKLHGTGEMPPELAAVLRHVERVAERVDQLVIAIASERRG